MVDEEDQVGLVLRNESSIAMCRIFWPLPGSNCVHIGCGLDSRFERVDNKQVEWYDLDCRRSLSCAGRSSAMKGGAIIFSLVRPSTLRG